jgi:hypothetical protein
MQTLTSTEQTAFDIIRNPNTSAADLILRAGAWAALKQARGQTVDLDNMAYILLESQRAPITATSIAAVRHRIENVLLDMTAHSPAQMARIRTATRSIAQAKGYPHGPYGGDAA